MRGIFYVKGLFPGKTVLYQLRDYLTKVRLTRADVVKY